MNKIHSILVYGQSTSGKTSLLGLVVREILGRMPGKKARLVTAEAYNGVQDLIDDGLVEAWKINTRSFPFDCIRKAADGAWPTDPNDPTSKLVFTPGYADTYPIRIFEGISTFANYIAGSSVEGALANRIGKGQQVGPTDSGELVRVEDGDSSIGGLSRSNYGFIQKEMTSVIQRSQKHAGYSIWTTHEDDVKEKKAGIATGRTIIGPEVFGGALTATIGREFADVWHVVKVASKDGGHVERRLYLRDHMEESAVAIARNSAPLSVQKNVPDFIRLTEEKGLPRLDAAKILLEKLPTF